MAEAAIHVAIYKLGVALGALLKLSTSLLVDEISLLTNLSASMNRVKSELSVVSSFLSANDMGQENKTLETWLEEVRKVAYTAEDVMDEFVCLTDQQHRSRLTGLFKVIKTKSWNMVSWHRIATQLKDIEANLARLSETKERWNMVENGGCVSSTYAFESHLHVADFSHFIHKDEIVGIAENKRILTEWLALEESANSIIAVWGMGGLGKTTLVTNVYQSEKKRFDCNAWISVSQSYVMEDLLRKIIGELFENTPEEIPYDTATMDYRRLKETLKCFLDGKSYLIIFDDMWSPKPFQDISDVLHNECRSKIIITTRSAEVASLAADNCKLELKSLQEEDAWDLFCMRVFWKEENRICPQELQDVAKKILLKCQGLPLAIASIGSFLSLKEKSESEWRRAYDQLNWELDNNPNLSHIKKILYISYKCLPRNLKNCFLYCSMFPEDYLLKRKSLIRLWMAEGFVEERGARMMEDVAEDYLKELTHLCMLQVVKKNVFGRIKHCRMHDLVRELAISISKREGFILLCDGTEAVRMVNTARRLSVLRCDNQIHSSIDLSRLRSFIVFDSAISFSLLYSLASKSRYLTVIDLRGTAVEQLPKEVCDLFNLQYLGLRGTKVKALPTSFGKLKKLQTLDLASSEIEKLPTAITELKNLRHLFAGNFHYPFFGAFQSRREVQTPEGLCNLVGLQTLQSVEANMEIVRRLGNLTQLRSLRIVKVRSIHCEQLCASISEMRCLCNLDIIATEDGEILKLVGLCPPLQSLQKLHLQGQLDGGLAKSPFFQSLGCSLRSLHLAWCRLTEDPLPRLSQITGLAILKLCSAYEGHQLCFSKGWFPNLKVLLLAGMPELNQVVIEKGALLRLDYLRLSNLRALKEVSGIEFLISLHQPLYLKDLHPEFKCSFKKTNG